MIKFRLKRLMVEMEERTNKRVTIGEVSKETGISRHTLSRMINQQEYSTSTDALDKLCKFFDCGIGDIAEYIRD